MEGVATPRLINKMSHSFVRCFVCSFNHSVSQSVSFWLSLVLYNSTSLPFKYEIFIGYKIYCRPVTL